MCLKVGNSWVGGLRFWPDNGSFPIRMYLNVTGNCTSCKEKKNKQIYVILLRKTKYKWVLFSIWYELLKRKKYINWPSQDFPVTKESIRTWHLFGKFSSGALLFKNNSRFYYLYKIIADVVRLKKINTFHRCVSCQFFNLFYVKTCNCWVHITGMSSRL